MLKTINHRIEYLYDREHVIGHSYFMSIKKEDDQSVCLGKLESIFRESVVPLLQEYFFNDYEKIMLVFGDNKNKDPKNLFVKKNDIDVKNLFFRQDSDEIDDEDRYMLNPDIDLKDPNTYIAIYTLLNQSEDNDQE